MASAMLDAYLSTFSNVTIYSATQNGTTPMTASTRPQEFLVVSMPEPAESVLLIETFWLLCHWFVSSAESNAAPP